MKKYRYILFTAGRGPVECGLAVQGVQMRFKKYLDSENTDYEIVRQQLGQVQRSIDTIIFKVERKSNARIDDWLGTIQWICKSPVRRYSKRKNWFIKCCEVYMPDETSVNLKDITEQAYRASGPGGQHRNKVETAIRLIHNPTGLIVTASDSRSKAQNKKRALAKLQGLLADQNRQMQQDFNIEEWSSKIEIQRGNPAKVFHSEKFTEL